LRSQPVESSSKRRSSSSRGDHDQMSSDNTGARRSSSFCSLLLDITTPAARRQQARRRVVSKHGISREIAKKVVLVLSRGPVKCPSTPNQPAPMTTAGGGAEDQRIAGFRLGEEADQPLRSRLLAGFSLFLLCHCKFGGDVKSLVRSSLHLRMCCLASAKVSASIFSTAGHCCFPRSHTYRGICHTCHPSHVSPFT